VLVHEHDKQLIKDPVSGHLWEICSCGYALDIDEMRGSCA
jgi:hypothetical protein